MNPDVPKPAAEQSFVIAASILGAVALAQLVAAVVALSPEIQFSALAANRPAGEVNRMPAAGEAAVPAGAPNEAAIMQANARLAEAEAQMVGGNFEGALEALAAADQLVPNDPGILFQMAAAYEELGKPVDAAAVLQMILEIPVDPANPQSMMIARQAELRLGELAGAATGAGGGDSAMMRDEVGIPIGSVLGIVNCRIKDDEPGFKNLMVATKGSSVETIDPGELKVVVFFYEQSDRGDIVPTDSNLMSEWLSPPTDWLNNEPELLEVKYALPATDRGDLPPMEYYGYVIGIYYRGELQDSRAEPVALLDEFPLQLSMPSTTP